MDEKLLAELAQIKSGLETKTAQEVKSAIDAFETKLSASNKTQFEAELKTATEAIEAKFTTNLKLVQDHADKLDVKLQEKQSETKNEDSLVKSIKDNFEGIANVRKGNALQVKTVGNMTLSNVSGDAPRTYNNDVVMIPGQLINVSDLVGSVNIEGGTYTYPREGAGEGSISAQTEGSSKSQRDYDFTMVDLATNFIAGFTRYSKKMANNLPFLTSFIPNALRRDYAIAENSIFNTVLAAAATASAQIITSKNKIEMLLNEIATQEGLNYTVNGIVVRPADYWDILKTEKSTGAGYGLPGIVTLEGGQLRINGIPIYKANWLAANKYYVGDWSRINKIVTEGLSLEFSETEGTNFVTNNITARIESQVGLAVEQPLAIVYGDFTSV
jgi:HK97 family phage major capsid protein